ncbi:MAG: hypothetical protein JWO19_2720 [Bryobacterales bacterium]|nr:hypothetical protein [Bryobacterales bacterium]
MFGQTNVPEPQEIPSSPNSRVLGVLPNYRTVDDASTFEPLTVRRKFYIGYKDSTDYPIFFLAAGLAGLAQLTDEHAAFRQGLKGYGKRLGGSVGDQVIGNLLTESVLPSLLHEDPRYFRRGHGGIWSRTGYAASRVLVARNDHGNWTFNFAEVGGNAIGAAIANAYYPGERNWGDNVQRFSSQMATDAFSQILKEFWPDIKRKYFTRHTHS